MNRSLVTALALALTAVTGIASAQSSYGYPQNNNPQGSYSQGSYPQTSYPQGSGNASYSSQIDFARVIRVDPVFDEYRAQPVSTGPRCYERPAYVQGDTYYGDDNRNGDSYYDPSGDDRRSVGTQGGRTAATVVGGIVGAVLGSKVGGGSARYATSAIGSMVGGIAGKSIYEQSKRSQQPRTGMVRVCDPVQDNGNYYPTNNNSNGERAVSGYDVTYEYAGKTYRTRTDHHPGDRIRVRVDVRPD